MISAIIFDCFGVLTSDAWLPFKNKHFGQDKQLFSEASDLSKQSDRGIISYDDFVDGIANLADMPSDEARHAIEGNSTNTELFKYVKMLKPDYKIGFLSNASMNHLEDLFTPEQIQLFDAITISYDTGFVKPDERAYLAAAEQLGVPIDQCVLVDDVERNCTAAREAGMQAVWFKDTDRAIAELDQLLGR